MGPTSTRGRGSVPRPIADRVLLGLGVCADTQGGQVLIGMDRAGFSERARGDGRKRRGRGGGKMLSGDGRGRRKED